MLRSHRAAVLTVSGKVYEGAIVERNPQSIVLETDDGKVTIPKRDIEVIKDRIECFKPTGVKLRDNGLRNFDAVIMATGFRPGLEELLPDDITEHRSGDGQSVPKTDHRCHSLVHDNLYFAGYDFSLWGGLSHGLWGFEVAEKIATKLGVFRPEMRPEEFGGEPWIAQ